MLGVLYAESALHLTSCLVGDLLAAIVLASSTEYAAINAPDRYRAGWRDPLMLSYLVLGPLLTVLNSASRWHR